jgi:hypothetical protein
MTVGSGGAFAKLSRRVRSVGLLREAPAIQAWGVVTFRYRHQVLAKEPRTSCIRHANKCRWVTFLSELLEHEKRMMGQTSSFPLPPEMDWQ